MNAMMLGLDSMLALPLWQRLCFALCLVLLAMTVPAHARPFNDMHFSESARASAPTQPVKPVSKTVPVSEVSCPASGYTAIAPDTMTFVLRSPLALKLGMPHEVGREGRITQPLLRPPMDT